VTLRREWIVRAGLTVAATPLFADEKKGGDEDVSPAEDLMREHGILKRVLLIYRNIADRIEAKRDFPPDAVLVSARLIRDFVENYHEKLEEDYLFPRFRKANQLVDLVETLNTRHQRGRTLTDRTMQLVKDPKQRPELRAALLSFVHMYEPHEAHEDTVLFPAFHKLVSKHEYDALGEEFEKKENLLFHGDGFERGRRGEAEKELGIYDLAQFTPTV